MGSSIQYTPHFAIPYPKPGATSWASTLNSFFAQAELTIGQHTHLILTAQAPLGSQYELGHIASGTKVEQADPGAGKFGRLVMQRSMVDGSAVLGRLLGISTVSGNEAEFGATLYHSAESADLTASAAEAVIADEQGVVTFLPLGQSVGPGSALVNGLLPVQRCPIVPSAVVFHTDPEESGGVFYISPPFPPEREYDTALREVVDAIDIPVNGATIDFVFRFLVPADFEGFPARTGAAFWAFRYLFAVTAGSADVWPVKVYGTDGVAHTDLGSPDVSSVNSMVQHSIRWAYVPVPAGSAGGYQPYISPGLVMEPGKECAVRIRVQATADSTRVAVGSVAQMQYLPLVRF